MTDTNDMRREFDAWLNSSKAVNGYDSDLFHAWQAATERATALERERCAEVLDALMTSRRRMNSSQKPDCEYVAAIRQGGAHD